MKAAWYEDQGRPADVLVFGEMADPQPGAGEVRIRMAASGINPGDLKKRENAFGIGMPYPRVIPHSDGAGIIDAVGDGVAADRIGERVWCHGAQSYRPFGTAAELAVVPAPQAILLPDAVSFQEGACLGIPAITAHRAVHAGGPVAGQVVLVQGGAGAVGSMAVGLALQAGAVVIATARSAEQTDACVRAGARRVVRTDSRPLPEILTDLRRAAPDGARHIVEVAFDVNIDLDMQILAVGGSIAAYATTDARPSMPFWDLLFKNARLFLVGSDDIPAEVKREAAQAVNALLRDGWQGISVAKTFPLHEIAAAHEYAQAQRGPGRTILTIA